MINNMRARRALMAGVVAAALTLPSCHFHKRDSQLEHAKRSNRDPQLEERNRRIAEELRKQQVLYEQHLALGREILRRRRLRSSYKEKLLDQINGTRLPHSCESGVVLPGDLKTHAFVFLWVHRNPATNTINLASARSHLHIYRILQHLVSKYQISTVVMEGRPNFTLILPKEGVKSTTAIFNGCARELRSKTQGKQETFGQNELEDICLLNFLLKGVDDGPLVLFLIANPTIKATGFEKIDETYSQVMKSLNSLGEKTGQQRFDLSYATVAELDLDGIMTLIEESNALKRLARESYDHIEDDPNRDLLFEILDGMFQLYNEATAPDIDLEKGKKFLSNLTRLGIIPKENLGAFQELFELFHTYGRYMVNTRSRYAVESIMSHSSNDMALVIGGDHMDSMVEHLLKIPVKDRPTVHFLDPHCQDIDVFVTPSGRILEIIEPIVEQE
jgi:hypothetical protein